MDRCTISQLIVPPATLRHPSHILIACCMYSIIYLLVVDSVDIKSNEDIDIDKVKPTIRLLFFDIDVMSLAPFLVAQSILNIRVLILN